MVVMAAQNVNVLNATTVHLKVAKCKCYAQFTTIKNGNILS